MLRTSISVLESVFSGVFLWLGLYLITRGSPEQSQVVPRWWRRPTLAIGVATIAVAWFLLGVAIQVVNEDPRTVILWQRMTWWGGVLACPFYFWGMLLVTADPLSSRHGSLCGRTGSLLLLACTAGIAVVGSTTNLIFQYDAVRRVPRVPQNFEVPYRSPFYLLEIVPILSMLLVTVFLLFRRYYANREDAREQFRWLGTGTVMLILGATISTAGETFFSTLSLLAEMGDAFLVVGLFLIGYGIARHNALFQYRVITRDFYRSLATVIVTSALFVLIFAGVHRLTLSALTPESIPLLIWLATVGVTIQPWIGRHLDRRFLSTETAAVREVIAEGFAVIPTVKDPQRVFDTMTERIKAIGLEQDRRELKEKIERDISTLLFRTNYRRPDTAALIARETGLFELAIVEEAVTRLIKQERLPMETEYDRDRYRLSALQQTIEDLVADIGRAEPKTDKKGDKYRKWREQYLSLRLQYVEGLTRAQVQQRLASEGIVLSETSYTRMTKYARLDLAERLYEAECLALERREQGGGR